MLDYQSAYHTNYSTKTSLVKLTNDLLWDMELKEVMALTALDLSTAFDTADFQILLEVLKAQFSIDDHVLNWFKTYLAPRKFVIDVEGHKSKEKDLQFSVPQGSVAGHVLYLAYASTIQYAINLNIWLMPQSIHQFKWIC